ncbi:hypothetical protein [Streptomyces lunalinharesii]|uniref:Uncharacterized protein n=1 Tax=Streptomyces lunalinharesii TaxID=333384 RepID=A0ABP6E1U3_9ACTN
MLEGVHCSRTGQGWQSLLSKRTRVTGTPSSERQGSQDERHGLDPPSELRRGRGEDVVELGKDAAAGGRADHAALGHHQADRRAEPERLAAIAPYEGGISQPDDRGRSEVSSEVCGLRAVRAVGA